MNPSNYQLIFVILLLLATVLVVVSYLRYKAQGTNRRMTSMLVQAGLDPSIAHQGDHQAVIKAIRSNCTKCQTEDVCERWLAGEIGGQNEFCPNAETFKNLVLLTNTS